jgi:plastocyanin
MQKIVMGVLALALAAIPVSGTLAEDAAAISIRLTDKGFEPAEITVPAGKPFTLSVKNETGAAAEFESNELRIEKVIAAGAEATVRVRAPAAGRHVFVNEFNEEVKGLIIAE